QPHLRPPHPLTPSPSPPGEGGQREAMMGWGRPQKPAPPGRCATTLPSWGGTAAMKNGPGDRSPGPFHVQLALIQTYLIWTVAPASSSFFFSSSATCFETFSTTFCGAPSTRSLASFRPRSGRAPRPSLSTLIFLSPPLVRTTVNSVCSSPAGAASPPAPPPAGMAMATGAAADTPHFSSSSLDSSAASSTVRADRSSTILSSLDIFSSFGWIQFG